jgi:hypothetical protein
MQLKAANLTFEEIGRQLGISRQAVHKTYWEAMREIAAEHKEEAELGFSEVLALEREIISEAKRIRDTPCQRCYGQQRVEAQLEDDGSPPWGADAEGRIICPHCRGSGYLYAAPVRLQAMTVVQRSNEHLSRIWGLEKIAGQMDAQRYDFAEDVLTMSNEDIDREYASMMAPVRASEQAWERAQQTE